MELMRIPSLPGPCCQKKSQFPLKIQNQHSILDNFKVFKRNKCRIPAGLRQQLALLGSKKEKKRLGEELC